jgi:hypothetical protein
MKGGKKTKRKGGMVKVRKERNEKSKKDTYRKAETEGSP